MILFISRWNNRFVLTIGFLLASNTLISAERYVINAEQIIENADSSKTFILPWIVGKSGVSDNHLRVRQSIPEVCRLLGMSNYLKDFVIWSDHLVNTAKVNNDGSLSAISMGHYVQSVTCISKGPYLPVITTSSKTKNSDGSITFNDPKVSSGPDNFLIHSGHQGACQLLGLGQTDKKPLEWSTEQSVGVSLAADGQIYLKELGTYLKSFSCEEKDQPGNKVG